MNKIIIILLFYPSIFFGQSNVITECWNNGNVLSQIHYKDGNRDGSCRTYYKSGAIMSEGFYKNGKMIGLWVTFYENGQQESMGRYKYSESNIYSRKDSVWKYYYDSGELESESIIKDGVEKLKFYDKEGNTLPAGEGC